MTHVMLGRTRRVHFVGIGGIGMSGIAELLANLGYVVSGSDLRRSDVTDRLATLGVRVAIGHETGNVGDADVVVVSSAVQSDNPEVVEARKRHVPVVPRAEMLAELMRLKFSIAIAGAHGKTTTTSMVALMLEQAGLDPTAIIGGRLSAFGSNARLGLGDYVVAEADESDRSFLKLFPTIAVITNIDCEHMDTYGSFERLGDAFVDFAERVPFYGAVVVCADDAPAAAMCRRLSRRTITYGFADTADVRGEQPVTDGASGHCRVQFDIRGLPGGAGAGDLALDVPGRHNLQNALAAVAVGLELGIPFERIKTALAAFRGVERRFQTLGESHGILVVDDYGHHPAEISAVLRTARDGRPARIVVVFQPHRFTRTRDLFADFGPALSLADVVVLTDIYPAGEPPIPGITIEALAESVGKDISDLHVVPLDALPEYVARLVKSGDVVITLGAGSIGGVGVHILDAIGRENGDAAERRGATSPQGKPAIRGTRVPNGR